jgi:hypothetical protein
MTEGGVMSRNRNRTTLGAVEKLIEQRRQFQDWLTKLDANDDNMPAHVIERVRNDYRGRLASVTKELSEHQDALREALSEAQDRHHHLEKQQGTKKDELAELRLRKQVGELDDSKFQGENSALQSALEGLKKELATALRDIERYDEILNIILEDTKKPEPPKPEPVAERKPEPRVSGEVQRPKVGSEDELAFLRSVTSIVPAQKAPQPQAAAPKRADKPAEKPAEKPREETPREAAVSIDAAPGLIRLEKETPPEPRAATKPAAGAGGIKCAECGTQNKPTEWYCEKCGAELSSF